MNRSIPAAAVALVLLVTGPLLLGEGVDLPDDALYYGVASWEWLSHSVRSGLSPFWVPGKLGGVSLFADVVPQGPFYPGAWLGLVLPSVPALGLAALLHALGTLLAVRWYTRLHGVGDDLAWLAGAAVAGGPLAVWAAIDFQVDAWPTFLWFPVALGCLKRAADAREQSDGASWRRWTALAGVATALLLLGSHLRLAVAAGAALALWSLLRGRDLPGAALAGTLGLLGGAPAILPMLAEARAQQAGGGLPDLATPPDLALGLWNLAGWLTPKVMLYDRDLGLGLVLGVGVVAAAVLKRREATLGRLLLFALLLVLAGSRLPGARLVLAPLTLLTHPVNLVFPALALAPLAVAGAVGLEQLLAPKRGGASDRRRVRAVVAGLLGLAGLRLALGAWVLPSTTSQLLYGLALVQVGAVGALLLRGPGRDAVVLLALLDLALFGVRAHLAVPSEPLRATHDLRGDPAVIAQGYLDVEDLARGFEAPTDLDAPEDAASPERRRAERDQANEEEVVAYEEEAPSVQERLLGRVWPVHAGMASGTPGLAGRSKMPPRRASALLAPVAGELADLDGAGDVVDHLFADGGRGYRLLEVFGARVAVQGPRVVAERPQGDGPCRLLVRTEVVPDEEARVRRLLDRAGGAGPALLEAPLPAGPSLAPAPLLCTEVRGEIRVGVQVPAGRRALVGVRRPLHPGWQVTDDGAPLQPVAVDQVHQAVLLDPGTHALTWRFRPPGLQGAATLAGLGWLLLVGLLATGLRRSVGVAGLLALLLPTLAAAAPVEATLRGVEEGVSYELLATRSLDLAAPDAVVASTPFTQGRARLDPGPDGRWFFLRQRIPRVDGPDRVFHRPWDLLPGAPEGPLEFDAVPSELAGLRATGAPRAGWWGPPLALALLVLVGFPLLRRRLTRGVRGASVRPEQARVLTWQPPPVQRSEALGIGVVLLVALGLRLPGMSGSLDLLEWSYGPGTARVLPEGETMPLVERLLFPACLELVHPPLWHLLSGALWTLGGHEWLLRLPALLASLGTVGLLWWLVRATPSAGAGAGLVAGALLAVAPPAVWFGHDATPYAFLGLAAVGSTLLLLRALDRGTLGAWSAWFGLLVLAFLCHYAAVFFALGQAAALLMLARRGGPWRLAAAQALAAGTRVAPVAVAWSALHFARFGPVALDTRLYADVYPLDPGPLPFLGAFAAVGFGAVPRWGAAALLTAGLAAVGVARARGPLRGLFLGLIAAFVLGCGFFYANLVGELGGKVFWGFRWVSWFLPLALGMAALGAVGAAGRGLAAAWAVLALATPLLPGVTSTRPDYAGAARILAEHLEHRDGLVALPLWGQRGPVRTYLTEHLDGRFVDDEGVAAWRFGDRLAWLEMVDERFPVETSLLDAHVDRVWVLVADERMFGREKFRGAVAGQALAHADRTLRRVRAWSLDHLVLVLYERPPLDLPASLEPSEVAAVRYLPPDTVPCSDGDDRWAFVLRGRGGRPRVTNGSARVLETDPLLARVEGGPCGGPEPRVEQVRENAQGGAP